MKHFIHEKNEHKQNTAIKKHYDVVVVGGGLSGMCAAIASARNGAKTAIIQDRSVFGGNCSSEVRMHIMGASCHWGKTNAAETGILMEMQLENKRLNDTFNYSIWDGVMWHAIKKQDGLDCYMQTTMDIVKAADDEIEYIEAYQMSTEKRFKFTADIYIDATGHGTLGYFAGAEYAIGREAATTFNEGHAPQTDEGFTMGNSMMFCARDTGHPVKFVKPDWAYSFDDSFFEHRHHGNVATYHTDDAVVVLNPDDDYQDHTDQLVEKYTPSSGYWWIELGGDYDDIIKDAEDIRWELYKTVYGVWDHIKNYGNHGAENYELTWFANIAGVRESRRLMGDYILTQADIEPETRKTRSDEVAYGGWPMDEHNPKGFLGKGEIPSYVHNFDGLYGIPYGCYCSKNIKNMMMVGRCISASNVAMSSTRVMATCAIGGQAAGTAAAMAVKAGQNPTEFGKTHIKDLRQQLLKDDCYIIGCKNEDEHDLARTATVVASSYTEGYEPEKVINGISRNTDDEINMWKSYGLSEDGEALTLKLQQAHGIKQVRITFDPNLSEERTISISGSIIEKQPLGIAKELVRDYNLDGYLEGKHVFSKEIRNNYQRLNIINLDGIKTCDEIKITCLRTNGEKDARIFEVRVY